MCDTANIQDKFEHSRWKSTNEIFADIEGRGEIYQGLVLDSQKNGMYGLIIATRASVPRLEYFESKWDEVCSTIGNKKATCGDIFRMFVTAQSERSGIEVDSTYVTAKWELEEEYERVYAEVAPKFSQYASTPKDKRNASDLLKFLSDGNVMQRDYEKSKYGFVPTYQRVAQEMLKALEIPTDKEFTLLDPTCGNGTFLLEAQKMFGDKVSLFGMDIQPTKAYTTAALLEPNKTDVPNIFEGDALKDALWKKTVSRFDVIASNPPYAEPRTKKGRSYVAPIYPKFVNLATKLADKVTMITPSRWFSPDGKHAIINKLRHDMVHNYGMRKLVEKTHKDVFDADIKGGISYFLLDKGYVGGVEFNKEVIDLQARLEMCGMLSAANDKPTKLLERHGSISTLCKSSNIDPNTQECEQGVPCLFSSRRGGWKSIKADLITKGSHKEMWKVAISRVIGSDSCEMLKANVHLVPAGCVVSNSFRFFCFSTEEEQKKFYYYLTSDSVLKLISMVKHTPNLSKSTFRFVPNIRDPSLLSA